jgi:hypothetical protein
MHYALPARGVDEVPLDMNAEYLFPTFSNHYIDMIFTKYTWVTERSFARHSRLLCCHDKQLNCMCVDYLHGKLATCVTDSKRHA